MGTPTHHPVLHLQCQWSHSSGPILSVSFRTQIRPLPRLPPQTLLPGSVSIHLPLDPRAKTQDSRSSLLLSLLSLLENSKFNPPHPILSSQNGTEGSALVSGSGELGPHRGLSTVGDLVQVAGPQEPGHPQTPASSRPVKSYLTSK